MVCVFASELRSFKPLEGSQGLPFIDQERSLGYTTKGGRKKRKRRSTGEEASVAMLLLLPWVGPSDPVVEDGAALHVVAPLS
jgi:hypothetical protein